jgi:hypothetical protein
MQMSKGMCSMRSARKRVNVPAGSFSILRAEVKIQYDCKA